jgi:hypothetical protein
MRKSATALAVVTALALSTAGASAVTTTTKPTVAQKLQLQYLVEEEKLARDVYTYLAANVTSQKFSNIARSEQTHMDNIAAILKTYNFYNPTTARAAGVFRNTELQKLYNDLTTEGRASIAAAFGVGVKIEQLDISDLQKMATDPQPADMQAAIALLLKGSQNHLAAFTR